MMAFLAETCNDRRQQQEKLRILAELHKDGEELEHAH
jgi:hypothetical protein